MKPRVRVIDEAAEADARRWRIAFALLLALLAAVAIAHLVVTERQRAAFRRACDAHGGLAAELDGRPLCLWAGAVIPVSPP